MKRRNATHLTKRTIDALEYSGKVTTSPEGKAIEPRCVKWDSEIKGLGIRVYPSGRKVWVFAFEAEGGRKRMMQLGGYPALTLDKAQKAAQGHGGRIATAQALGTAVPDPLQERETSNQRKNVNDLVKAFLEQHVDARLRPTTAKEYRRQLETHVKPRWGSRLVASIRRSDVAALHTTIGETATTQANRTLSAVSKMFTFARLKGFLPDDAVNPARGVEKFSETTRDRWVRAGELPRLVEAINAESNVYIRSAIWLFLLTGLRRGELLAARWDWVDEERWELRLPETKAGRVHYVPLSEAAKAVLKGIPKEAENPFILCGRGEGGRLGDINHPWDRIRKAAGVGDVRLHDLRRTVGSWLATAGESLPLIGKTLNHKTASTTQIYARLAEDPVRRALEEHGQRITEAAQGLRMVK